MSLAVKEHLSLDTVFSALHQFGSSFASLDLLRLRVILDIFFSGSNFAEEQKKATPLLIC